jgi:hypothetical protein
MAERKILAAVADQIRDYILLDSTEHYFQETGVNEGDFQRIESLEDFEGNIFAIDGSNGVIFDLTAANFNLIRAGYVVYRDTKWQKTVTFDKIFRADKEDYNFQFERDLKNIFHIESRFHLAETELDRLSTYFRELQEYVALSGAINEAKEGDLVLYDGEFAYWKDPFIEVLVTIFTKAKEKGVDLLGISKSSTFSWGKGFSKPFVQHTNYVGSQVIPDYPWYIELSGKNVKPEPKGKNWNGNIYIVKFNQRSEYAFRVDTAPFFVDRIDKALGHASKYSNSAECLGYPHALFRAHRDIRIEDQERMHLNRMLLDELSSKGINELQIRGSLDYHLILEMQRGRMLL